MKLAFQASMLLALIVGGVMGTAAQAQTQLFITDNQGVHRYDFQSSSLTTLVPDDGDPGNFMGLTIGPNGNLFVAALLPLAPQIFEYNPNTGAQIGSEPFVDYEGDPPSPDPHDVIDPRGLGFSPTNGRLYVGDISPTTSNVHMYDSAGASLGAVIDDTGTLNQPWDVAFDASGNLYVVNPGAINVLKSVGGTAGLTEFVTTATSNLVNPIALTFGPDGELYVLDQSTSNINRYNADGSFDTVFAHFDTIEPSDLAFGPDGKLYVSGNDFIDGVSVIVRLTSSGADDGVLIDSGLTNPHFLAFRIVPEPSGLSLLAAGIVGMGAIVRKKRRRQRA